MNNYEYEYILNTLEKFQDRLELLEIQVLEDRLEDDILVLDQENIFYQLQLNPDGITLEFLMREYPRIDWVNTRQLLAKMAERGLVRKEKVKMEKRNIITYYENT